MEVVIGYLVIKHERADRKSFWEAVVLCKSGYRWSLGCFSTKSYTMRVITKHTAGHAPVFCI